MPIYEYRCPEGHTFELFQRMTDPPPDACELCGASPVSKVLYPAAIHFKGSGFYSTDYGRGGRKRDGKEGEAAPSEKSADDSKPAKTETKESAPSSTASSGTAA
jgi:putative FmdB family regulatory protein